MAIAAAHVADQLGLGRPVIVDVDAFYLPDTSGTSYRSEHVKTSIAIQALDQERRVGYFHNSGYYELGGEDFAGLFPPRGPSDQSRVPAALRGGGQAGQPAGARRRRSRRRSRSFGRTSREGPPTRSDAMPSVSVRSEGLGGDRLACFHSYAFATLRQCGAAFELGGAYLRWLEAGGERGLEPAAEACKRIATTAKTLQFKTARAVNTQKPVDPAPLLDQMAAAWDETMAAVTARYGA